MAEELLETVGQVFGPVRGGLAVAVILVGALLAATTGVVAAAVISMGLISLPIMLRYGYNRTIATGTITASDLKFDLQFAGDGVNTLSVYAVSLVEYES